MSVRDDLRSIEKRALLADKLGPDFRISTKPDFMLDFVRTGNRILDTEERNHWIEKTENIAGRCFWFFVGWVMCSLFGMALR